ncbi:MAG TPA: class I SAM-dependent methyltransferase [Polyangiaceae bacterium]
MTRPERANLAERSGDKWRPPALEPARTSLGQVLARVRRYFDFQAGSCWADVEAEAKSWSGKVVDLGCGAQPYRSLLPAGMDYVGLDIANAEAAFGYAPPNVIYFDGGRWPAATHGADVVLCTEVLEHVLDPAATLSEAFSALKPGGRLMLTVPFAARWHFVPYDYWRYTPSGLKHLLEAAGFRKVVVHARGDALTVACYKVQALMLPFFMPQQASAAKALALRVLASPSIPFFVGLAVVGNWSLRGKGGDDCLGYTVTAERPLT